MAQEEDYYKILGIPRTASKDEIKSAYRKLAKQYHPDVNKEAGAEEKFRQVQEAYDTLYDDDKRSYYDRVGHDNFKNQARQGGNPGGDPFGGAGGFGFGEDLSDIFASFFGGGRQRQNSNPNAARKGNDVLINVNLSFMDAAKGRTVTVELNVDEVCSHCHGSGAESPKDVTTCGQCNGRGYIKQVQRSLFGQIEREVPCPNCNGKGKIITNKCHVCRGSGYVRNKKQKSVNIPAGISNGQQMRLQGLGGRGANGGPNGDAYLEVKVQSHKQFKREGNDIHIDIPVSFYDAILGKSLKVPTIFEDVEIKIPPGSKDGDILRLKGHGIKNKANGGTGDEYIHIKVTIPKKLDKKQQAIIEEIKKNMDESTNSEYAKFLKSIQR